MIEKCYYINLDKRSDRRIHIESELNRSKILNGMVERFSAVDGMKIHPRSIEPGILTENAIDDILAPTISNWGLSITQGGLGVILTYSSLFNEIKNSNKVTITFEDDIILSKDFDDRLEKITKELPSNFDICYLGYSEIPVELKYYSENLRIPRGRVLCLPGLIISPAGAKKLLNIIKNLDNQIDTALMLNFDKLNVYVSSDKIVKIPNKMGSNIQGDINCKKEYPTQNYIFTTLAIGNFYNEKAQLLAKDLNYFNQKILIVTDQPDNFATMSNVIIHKFECKKFSYNYKILCFQEALKLSDAVVYIDADCRILYKTYKNTVSRFSLIIPTGFHKSMDLGKITRTGNKYFESNDVAGRVAGYGEFALKLCKDLEIDYEQANHYQEGIIVLCKEDGKEKVFLETWAALAEKLDCYETEKKSKKIGVGEGNLVGLALVKSGMTIHPPKICNILGENIKYNFRIEMIMNNFPDRKIVQTSSAKQILDKSFMVDFKEAQVSLRVLIYEVYPTTNMLRFEWNKNGAVEFLDHEFKINEKIYHFQSNKNEEFFFNKTENFDIYHTYDWYGEKSWKKILEKTVGNKERNMKPTTFNSIKHWDENLMYKYVKNELNTIYEQFDKFNLQNISFVDIGSNVGKFYEEISKKYEVKKCVMVEASFLLSEYTREKFKNIPNLFIHNFGLSDLNGDFYFDDRAAHIEDGGIDASGKDINLGLSKKTNSPGSTKFHNSSYFLENICEIKPEEINFIKVDTENQDLPIVSAMSDYLLKNKINPIILFENNFHNMGMSVAAAQKIIDEFCAKCGYKSTDLYGKENVILIPYKI